MAVFPFSEALVSITAGLLLFQVLVMQSWKHPSVKERKLKNLLLILSIFGVYLVGMIFTNDFSFAVYELKKVIFWIIIPTALFLSPALDERKILLVFSLFIAGVTVSSLIFTGKLILHNFIDVENIRSIGFVSNIRFSFQVILALIMVTWFYLNGWFLKIKYYKSFALLLSIWLVTFLFLLQSLLGIIALIGTACVALLYYVTKVKQNWLRIFIAGVVLVIISVSSYYIISVISDFYDFKEINPATVDAKTISGNLYHHDFETGARENGHLVYVYVCDDELRREWNKRSDLKYDEMLNGYPLSITLIRYMSSLGYRKDSAGCSKLTAKDVELVEQGITNYKFDRRFFSIYPRVYETVWEIDNYIRSGDPNNKSLAQRIEFVKASLLLIKKNPVFGIGTGNWVIKYDEVYETMHSKLNEKNRGPSHNQYLNYMVKFGIVGFIWIFSAILIPVFNLGHKRNYIFLLFLVSIAFANFGDANLETHMGLSFFTLFYSLFLWHSTARMKSSITTD